MVPCMVVLHRLSCRTTWPNHVNLRRLTVASSGSRGPTRLSQPCSVRRRWSFVPRKRCGAASSCFSSQTPVYAFASSVHVSQPYGRKESVRDLYSLYLVGTAVRYCVNTISAVHVVYVYGWEANAAPPYAAQPRHRRCCCGDSNADPYCASSVFRQGRSQVFEAFVACTIQKVQP